MNIAIIGTNGVGKTTLFEAVKEKISPELNFDFFDEKPLEENEEIKTLFGYMKAHEDIIESHLRIKKWGEFNKRNIIIEGCPLLNISYMIVGRYTSYNYNFHSYAKVNIEMLSSLSDIVDLATVDSRFYTHIFYIPIEFYPNEKTTKEELIFRSNVDEVLRNNLRKCGVKYHTVKGTVDERTDFVLKTIEESIGEIK